MKAFLTLMILSASAATNAFAHGDDKHFPSRQEVEVRVTQVRDNVYMLQGRGGNVGAIVGKDGILIIDDDYKVVSEKLRKALKDLGSDTPRFIFNTHWHGDHTEGNLSFGERSIIVAHDNVRRRLMDPPVIFGEKTPAYPTYALPMITYASSMSIHFDGDEVLAMYYPAGHTDGDSVILFKKANVLHLGDHFFVGRFPFVDLDSGGSVKGLLANIASIIRTAPPDVKIIPGHGPLAGIEDLKTYHAFLSESVRIVEDAMKKGRSLEEIKQAGLPEKFAIWGTGFIKTHQWIETVHRSLSKK